MVGNGEEWANQTLCELHSYCVMQVCVSPIVFAKMYTPANHLINKSFPRRLFRGEISQELDQAF
jgi:hypothetical protein